MLKGVPLKPLILAFSLALAGCGGAGGHPPIGEVCATIAASICQALHDKCPASYAPASCIETTVGFCCIESLGVADPECNFGAPPVARAAAIGDGDLETCVHETVDSLSCGPPATFRIPPTCVAPLP